MDQLSSKLCRNESNTDILLYQIHITQNYIFKN